MYSRDVFVVPGAAALQHAAQQAEHQTRQDRRHSDGADDTHGQCDAGLTVTFPDADPLSAFRRR